MSRKRTQQAPSEEEILAYSNVPLELAAKFVGVSSVTLRYALQDERAPFGFAAQNPETGTWTYNISPGLLIGYKRGTIQAWRLHEVSNLAAEGIKTLVNARLSAAMM